MTGNCSRSSMGEMARGILTGGLAAAALIGFPVAAAADEVSYQSHVKPILEETCYQCHGADKDKGDLRVHTPEAIMKGVEGSTVLVPGKPEESTLYTRVILPADDIDIMPAKGDTLTKEQQQTIHDWILAGASFEGGEKPMKKEEAAEGGVSFAKTIWPVLQERCVDCHGPDRQKGEFRLDSPEAILKGGEHHGASVVAGKPEESPLYKLISLPPDDVDIMPAKGDTLTPEQIEAVKTWIAAGADFGDWTAETAIASMQEGDGGEEQVDVLAMLAENTQPAESAQLEAVSSLGGLAMPLDMKTPLVRVDYHLIGDQIADEQLGTLPPLSNQLTWLNLAGTKITDAGLANVSALPKLTRLHLERTGITDAGLKHLSGLEHLEYLNLYGTKVTDAGLEHLKGLENLKKIFLWQTDVTEEGAAALQAANPDLKVDLGLDPDAVPETGLAKVIPAAMFTEGSCCAKAAAENKVCEHECCEKARQENTVCTKCNEGAGELLAIVAKFDKDGCCDKAYAGGKLCDHDCCKEAWAAKELCAKCNPEGAAAAAEAEGEPEPEKTALEFDEGSCCAQAKAQGNECDHPCCVEALAKNAVCKSCNPKAA